MADLALPTFTGLQNTAAATKTKHAVAWKEGQALDDAGFKAALARYLQRCLEDHTIQLAKVAAGSPQPTTDEFGDEIGVAE